MASSALSRRTTTVRSTPSRKPSPKLIKVQTQLANLRKRAAGTAVDHGELIASVGVPVAFVALEKKMLEKGDKLPTVMGLDPAVLYGAIGYFFGRKFAGGKAGRMVEAAGQGLLAYGAGRSTYRGSVKVAGEGDDDDGEDLT
jgi:hypothetical protein